MQATGEHTGGSILVMDDDEMIRDVASSMLTHLGYEVTICADGDPIMSNYREYGFSGAIAKPYNIHNFKEVLGLLLTH